MRCGVLARKLGMSRLFAEDGEQIPVTVLALEDCRVVGTRSRERDGYTAVQVGAGHKRAKTIAKPQQREYAARQIAPCAKLREFRVEDDMLLEAGAVFSADHFVPGQRVDIAGTTKGCGFSGAMKRWGFKGLRATHGVSISHRSHGSTGQCQDPGKVFKGKKMAGQYGGDRKTTQNLEIVKTDPERGLLLVRGGIAGARNSWVEIRDAVKIARPDEAPVPAGLRQNQQEGEADIKDTEAAEAEAAPETVAMEAQTSEGSESTGSESTGKREASE